MEKAQQEEAPLAVVECQVKSASHFSKDRSPSSTVPVHARTDVPIAVLAAVPFTSNIGNWVKALHQSSDRSHAGVMQTSGHVQALRKPVVRHHPLCARNGSKNQPTTYGGDMTYHDFRDVPCLQVSHHPEERGFALLAPKVHLIVHY